MYILGFISVTAKYSGRCTERKVDCSKLNEGVKINGSRLEKHGGLKTRPAYVERLELETDCTSSGPIDGSVNPSGHSGSGLTRSHVALHQIPSNRTERRAAMQPSHRTATALVTRARNHSTRPQREPNMLQVRRAKSDWASDLPSVCLVLQNLIGKIKIRVGLFIRLFVSGGAPGTTCSSAESRARLARYTIC
ncbi:hypothetical protein J6590_020258 [Homalodisca vitripennis]|nr:hypothetical protein J6590_020258 [Homalodisca vitripennis]